MLVDAAGSCVFLSGGDFPTNTKVHLVPITSFSPYGGEDPKRTERSSGIQNQLLPFLRGDIPKRTKSLSCIQNQLLPFLRGDVPIGTEG